ILQTIGTVMSERNFYLAGGTALAIYYGHRMSVDLDWFTGAFPSPQALRSLEEGIIASMMMSQKHKNT
ncbi:MAG: nucleotidyl transferase AbiEii/AbiGii toxin family protein, partial [Chloroflexota bacterium]